MIFEKIRTRLEKLIYDKSYLFNREDRNEDKYFFQLMCLKDEIMPLINQVEAEYNNGWIPCSERLPEETGYYLCTVEWYGTSTKELLLNNGHIIEERILLVHFLDSTKTFKCCENYCTYKVTHWQPLPQPPKGE